MQSLSLSISVSLTLSECADVETAITVFFAFEAVVKIIALGFVATSDTVVATRSYELNCCGLNQLWDKVARKRDAER